MASKKDCLNAALKIEGAVGAALGDWNTGFSLGQVSTSSSFSEAKLEIAIALNSEVIKAKNRAREALGLKSEIEDILITLKDQYHLIRPCESMRGVFFYIVLERAQANLGLARIKLRSLEQALEL